MIRFLLPVFLVVQFQAAGQHAWIVDSVSVSFQILNAGIPVHGTFDVFDASITFDPDRLDQCQITASVDANTVNSGIRIRDNHLRKADFFHVEMYPLITITSENIRRTEAGKYLGEFTLNLKGREHLVPVPFAFQDKGSTSVFEGSFKLDRRDYGIGGNSMILGDTVHVYVWVRGRKE